METLQHEENLLAYESDDEQNNNNKKNQPNNNKISGLQEIQHDKYAGVHATTFKEFSLKAELIQGINEAGFESPSEVQQECIPQAVLGTDILCQAKSGMGKTAVFVLSILQQLPIQDPQPISALVLCNTRLLAHQIGSEFSRLGKYLKNVSFKIFFGGAESIQQQKKILDKEPPTIIIGTPGRIYDLVKLNYLKLDKLQYFILDECDKMLQQLDMRGDIIQIFKQTPHNKQVMMFSATLNEDLKKVCRKFMQKQMEVFIDDESKLTLHGLKQYYTVINENQKNKKLVDLLDEIDFNQVVIFVKSSVRAIYLTKILKECKFPAVTIHSGLSSAERIQKYKQLKDNKFRILVSTDQIQRGIDIARVNLVINYDMPDSSDSYLHRVGRAGRFGTKGLTITFSDDSESDQLILKEIQSRFVVEIQPLPDQIDKSIYLNN